jgi:transposase
MKTTFITFFDIKDTVRFEFILQGQSITQTYYVEILKRLHEDVRRNGPELWANDSILHHDNAPANKALSVKQFVAQKPITEMEHQPYSPDLVPKEYWLFLKLKSALKGRRFQDTKVIKKM